MGSLWADERAEYGTDVTEQQWSSVPDRLLVELAEPPAPGRALDVGRGPGRNSLWLAVRRWQVTALDRRCCDRMNICSSSVTTGPT